MWVLAMGDPRSALAHAASLVWGSGGCPPGCPGCQAHLRVTANPGATSLGVQALGVLVRGAAACAAAGRMGPRGRGRVRPAQPSLPAPAGRRGALLLPGLDPGAAPLLRGSLQLPRPAVSAPHCQAHQKWGWGWCTPCTLSPPVSLCSGVFSDGRATYLIEPQVGAQHGQVSGDARTCHVSASVSPLLRYRSGCGSGTASGTQ